MEREIYTKSILKESDSSEGRRISVMSRHTRNDGVTPDERIKEEVSFDEWRNEFAPPGKLIGAYYRGEILWEEFAKKYVDFLRSDGIQSKIELFAKRCTEETITLMCVEDTAERCHRRLLAEELKTYEPSLTIIHK